MFELSVESIQKLCYQFLNSKTANLSHPQSEPIFKKTTGRVLLERDINISTVNSCKQLLLGFALVSGELVLA